LHSRCDALEHRIDFCGLIAVRCSSKLQEIISDDSVGIDE
jgi:hypothetical protein